MKHKVIVTGMTVFLLASMIAGCGKKEVDYEMEESGKAKNNSSSLAEFKELENWTDQWTVSAAGFDSDTGESKEGEKVALSIDAEIIVPDVDAMSVVEAEQTAIDGTFRKQFFESFFGDSEIYYHDKAHYTKTELEQAIAELEESHAQFEAEIAKYERIDADAQVDVMKEELQASQKQLQEWKELLPQVSDNYTVATEFESCNEYAGYLGELLCHVTFRESSVMVKPLNAKENGPKTLQEYQTVSKLEHSNNEGENIQNECKLSMADAQRLAEDFMKNIGRSNQICLEKKNLTWHGENTDEHSNVTDEEYAIYGYSFTYGTGVDGVDFLNSEMFSYYKQSMIVPEWMLSPPPDSLNGDSITLIVTDEGITEVFLQHPLDVVNVTKQVKLLPIDTVKEIMRNEVMENQEYYHSEPTDTYNRMELLYMRYQDNSKEGISSYAPTWCLANYVEGTGIFNGIFVNAIDGSVGYMTVEGEDGIYLTYR